MKKNYKVTGMSCAACSARVQKAVSNVNGVAECNVNLLTGDMTVDGQFDGSSVIAAVKKAGYGVHLQGNVATDETDVFDVEVKKLKTRFISSLVFLIMLMYVSMGMMLGFPLPSLLSKNHAVNGLTQLLLSGIILVINQRFFISGFKALIKRSPNMDTLVALGSTASFAWSVYALFKTIIAISGGDNGMAAAYMDEFYFESAAMIVTLITIGKMLEAKSKGRTSDALKSLVKLKPQNATVVIDGKEVIVPIGEVKVGDVFVVRPGESVPVDGIVEDGETAIDESALTGESIPVDKAKGDRVSAATINSPGFIKCRATKVGEDTALSQIIKMVSDASSSKAPIAKIADKVSGFFVPVVMGIALVTFVVWMLIGKGVGYSLARGISVLVISCPCALGLATPVAIMVGNGVGAKNGILFKTAETLENAGKTNIVALDKTGTITRGTPVVTDIIAADGVDSGELMSIAVSLESKSEHPLAKAIMQKAKEIGIDAAQTSNFKAVAGNGLTAIKDGQVVSGGNMKFIGESVEIPQRFVKLSEQLSFEGKTPLFFACDGKIKGIIAVADTIKEDSRAAIRELKNMGMEVVMITGDNQRTAEAIGRSVGVDNVIASVLPNGKRNEILKLKKRGKVAMVGDGINDAPSLTEADVGIAIGAGADVAVDAADIVLMKSSISDVPAAIKLSKYTIRNIKENLFWAFIYNTIGIPIAAGCFVALGLTLNPMFGAAAMSLSSFCVVVNALRLNLCKIYKPRKLVPRRKKSDFGSAVNFSDEVGQTVIATVNGMTCEHCVARVADAVRTLSSVKSVNVDLKSGQVTIIFDSKPVKKDIKSCIKEAGYKVVSVKVL